MAAWFELLTLVGTVLVLLPTPTSANRKHPLLSDLHNMPIDWVAGYNMGDLLNMPSFLGLWPPHGSQAITDASRKVGKHLPNSTIGLYHSNTTAGMEKLWHKCREPNIKRLKVAIQLAQKIDAHPAPHLLTLVRSADTLVVHVRSGDTGIISEEYEKHASNLVHNFSHIVLLGQVHGDKRHDTDKSLKNLRHDLQRLAGSMVISKPDLSVTYGSFSPDHDLYLMSEASNLLVHKGGFSGLAALVCRGTVFYTKQLIQHAQGRRAFEIQLLLSLIKKPQPLPPNLVARTEWTATFDLMGPVSPSCCILNVYGNGDGEKFVCSNAPSFVDTSSGSDCWIASIGSNGDFSFEYSVYEQSSCHIHTFDCTGTWEVPHNISSRVTLHPICVSDHTNGSYMAWNDIVARATNGKGTPPAYLKMDVEGWEYAVLPSLAMYPDVAPEQIAVELHVVTYPQAVSTMINSPWGPRPGTNLLYVEQKSFVSLMSTMFEAGYKLVWRQDNKYCAHCSEILLMRDSFVD
jgi:hypothetical protein